MEKKNNITLQTADLSRTKTLAAFTSWAPFFRDNLADLENLKPYWCWNKNSLYQTLKTYIPQQICLCQTFKEKEDESISWFWIGVPDTLSFLSLLTKSFRSGDSVASVWPVELLSVVESRQPHQLLNIPNNQIHSKLNTIYINILHLYI